MEITNKQWGRMELMSVLNDVESLVSELTEDELNDLINDITRVYEHYSENVDMIKHDKPE